MVVVLGWVTGLGGRRGRREGKRWQACRQKIDQRVCTTQRRLFGEGSFRERTCWTCSEVVPTLCRRFWVEIICAGFVSSDISNGPRGIVGLRRSSLSLFTLAFRFVVVLWELS
ncbi:hypothetical protein KC19_10G090500 [Ceratodon purpureus]|uniref:Uncharacterized protein n=1 Tax=Ceratodon purpureus TaxID=3225 RepID=A0A8T0GNC0_CERPU|nr:hypothetical protein KC19_10G090500 [Ceratodon purpureus]